MTLRKKTLFTIGLTLAICTVALHTLAVGILSSSLQDAEHQDARNYIDSVSGVLRQSTTDFSDRFADWSSNDGSFPLAAGRNDKSLSDTFSIQSQQAMRVHLIALIDARGNLLWGTSLRDDTKRPIEKHVVHQLRAATSQTKFARNSEKSGLMIVDGAPMIIAAQTVLLSVGSGPSHGTLIVGRRLDSPEVERLAKAVNVKADVWPRDATDLPGDFAAATTQLKSRATWVRPVDESTLAAYAELNDINDRPALLMRIMMPREIYQQSRDNIRTLVGTILLAGLVITLATLMMLERSVLAPVARLSADVQRIGASGDTSTRLRTTGDDELGHLAKSINDMLATVEGLRRERESNLDELRRARDEAQDANRSKSQFLANMSHELRTPLNAIIGYSEMLHEEAEETGQHEFAPDLEKIQKAGKHLLALINDILDLSKIEAGKMELFLENFNTDEMVRDVVTTITPLAEKNGNELVITMGENLGEMRADLTKVRQILFNLLSNACKFTERGTVEIEVSRHRADARDGRDWMQFRVVDSGIGLTPEQQRKLFQTFSQADASTTRRFGGTGLGLAITKRFCEMLGGTVEVESEFGKRTCFTVLIPAEVDEPESVRHSSAGSVSIPEVRPGDLSSPPLVLCIDDDPTMHDLMQRYLAGEGFRVAVAGSGQQGLELARSLKPNAITLDVMMPGMDGWAVLSALKADTETAGIPVVMLTIVQDRSIGYALGVSDYLTKPIERSRLLQVLERVRSDGSSAEVLIVEDDANTRSMLRRMLEKEGCRVREAENGRIAFEEIEQNGAPHVILLDLMMPEMDGFSFVNALRADERWRDVPVVVVTAKDISPEDRERLSGGVQQILQKGSYSREELLQRVKSLVSDSMSLPATGDEM